MLEIKEVAEGLNCTKSYIYLLLDSGYLTARKVEGLKYIRLDEKVLVNFLSSDKGKYRKDKCKPEFLNELGVN